VLSRRCSGDDLTRVPDERRLRLLQPVAQQNRTEEDLTNQNVANKIIDLAVVGERNRQHETCLLVGRGNATHPGGLVGFVAARMARRSRCASNQLA
jgi:hypothetical protein